MRLMLLGLLVLSPWPNAMNAPAYYGALFAVSSLFLLKVCLPRPARSGFPAPRKFDIAALCFIAALFWAFLQALPIWPAGLAHPVWAAVSKSPAPISASPGLTIDALMLLTAYGVIFAYTAREAADRRFARLVLVAIGAAAALSALAGMVLFSSGDVSLFGAAKRVYRGRLTGPFINANLFASYLALGLIVLIALAAPSMSSPRGGWRALLWRAESFLREKALPTAGVVLVASALLLTASRGGVIAGGIGAGALVFSYVAARVRSGKSVFAPLAALAVIAIIVAASSAAGLEKRLVRSAFGSEGREEVYRLTASMIEDRWLTGHGLGAFQDALPAYYSEADMGLGKPFLYAHNLYAELVAGLGAPAAGLLLFAAGVVIAQCASGAFRRRSQARMFPSIALACAAAIGAHGLVDDPLALPANAVAFSAVLGVGYGQSRSRG